MTQEITSMGENLECGDFTFYNDFDSANLAKVENVEIDKAENGKNENNKTNKSTSTNELPSYEFNLWTKQDCQGTEYQNNNRTWFYFGIKAPTPNVLVKLNLVNLNKQVKMFSQGMCPVFKIIPGHPHWERIKEKPTFIADDKNNEFVLSFTFRTPESPNAIIYFAFTYPFSYTDLQNYLKKLDSKMTKQKTHFPDDVYYHRECAIKSLEGRRLDVLTISSYYNILPEREAKIKDLFPEDEKRPYKFRDKKIIFISARVHPGETPSSFVLNGFLNLLLNREDPIAVTLRRQYVFKLIPMLNPDGVAQGYYRMDTRGVNLNRLYLNPSKLDHPTIFAAKHLLRYYHNLYNLPEDLAPVPEVVLKNKKVNTIDTSSVSNFHSISNETNKLLQRVTLMSLEEKNKCIEQGSRARNCLIQASDKSVAKNQEYLENQSKSVESTENIESKLSCSVDSKDSPQPLEESGIFLYLDFHGHASKKGIFMYGNHFDDPEDSSSCMLLPKLMSINNPNFHFTSCNFAEKNMYLIDKRDGMSREGSGRVAVYKLFGLIHSYTLECNYNTGRLVNNVPARVKEGYKLHGQLYVPPKYNPSVFEEVGAALGPSILDMTGSNPNSRVPNSQYRSLNGLKSYLKLISTTNSYQSSLNKPLHKNNGADLSRSPQDSAFDELIEKTPSKTSTTSAVNSPTSKDETFSNDKCRKIFRTAHNIIGSVVKIKNTKRSRQLTNRSVPTEIKRSNRETKIVTAKIITKPAQPKCQLITTHKKIVSDPKTKCPFKGVEVTNKVKIVEKSITVKLPLKNSMIKSTIFTKRAAVIKKQGPQKLKTNALTKIRTKIHKFQSELGESSKIKPIKIVNTSHTKQKRKKNGIIKTKKHSPKHKSPKKSSKT